MTDALLDTNVFITAPSRILGRIDHYRASTIVRSELEHGYRLMLQDNSRAEEASIRLAMLTLLDQISRFWVNFDTDAAIEFGKFAGLDTTRLRAKDALIAAHSLSL
ncbi:PIN domain-containing protein [Mycetocola sp. JXN-3]|uniref:PIN domain-containing protein n=1 Tax=Mycetocola sp. JXN-3 TaxID=2116510 RepID=UPI00165D11A9|nr:PIN domain-containing protein [Mycetocola sp. JXN-3]